MADPRLFEPSRARLAGWLVLVLWGAGCAGAPTRESPPDLPPITAAWGDLTYQLPVSADIVLLASLDDTTRAEVSQVFGTVDLVSDTTSRLSDVLGVDLSSPDAFDRLGLAPGGGLALAVDDGFWLVLVDVVAPGATREVLDGMGARNPDLAMSWREVDDEDVLGIALPDDGDGAERVHVMVTDTQLLVLVDRHPVVDRGSVDTYLTTHRQPVPANVRFNQNFIRAVLDLGGASWGLYVAEVPALFTAMSEMAGPQAPPPELPGAGPSEEERDDAGGFFGPSPGPERCQEVATVVAGAVPVIDGSIEREPVAAPEGTREVQRFRLHVAPTHRSRAEALLQAPRLDQAALFEGALLAGYLRLDRETLVRDLAPYSDAAACAVPAALAGWLGRLGSWLSDASDLGEEVDGLVTSALFDLRNSGGVPFADLFVGLGSDRPNALSQSLQAILETQLGLYGTPANLGRIPTVSYRFALLYRLTLLEGDQMLGLSMGVVPDPWLEAVLEAPREDTDHFLWIRLDGEGMQRIYDTLVEFAVMGVEDEAMAESQRVLMDDSMDELRRLRFFELTGRYAGGIVTFESEQVTAAEGSPGGPEGGSEDAPESP